MSTSEKKSKSSTMDMTQGSPAKMILLFAIPLFIGNIFQQVYSMVDTMVTGYNLGDSAIAAIGATSSLYGLIIDFVFGLNSGCAIVVTQCFGARDSRKLKESIAGMIEIDAAAAGLLTVLSLAFLRPLLRFMNTPAAIFEDAYRYIAIICIGMAAAIAYNMFSGILRAFGNSRTSLYILIFSSILNIVLDILFIAVFRMGVAGAALATVIAETASAALCGIYVWKNYKIVFPKKEDFKVSAKMLKELFSNGMAMALMYCVVALGSVIFQRANNHLGETIISAHTASRRIIEILMQPLSTIAAASSTFVGQNWGARKKDRIRRALGEVFGMEIGFALAGCAMVYLAGSSLVRITTGTSDPQVIENAVMSLKWHLSFFPVLGCLLSLRTAMQAMGEKTLPILSSCIELGMKLLSAAVIIPYLGFFGTSITEPVTWCCMLGFLMIGSYRKKRKEWNENQGGRKDDRGRKTGRRVVL